VTSIPAVPARPTPDRPVVVVGGGISGVACARVLHDAGIAVRLLDRGKRIGGRMAVRHEQIDGTRRAVDIGASYFTVRDDRFAALAEDWRRRGLARVWTRTFRVIEVDKDVSSTTGDERWSAVGGLRSLVEDLARGIDVTPDAEVEEVDLTDDGLLVDGRPAAAVVLAMPEPQGYDLLPEPVAESLGMGRGLDWSPTIAVWAAWPKRWWEAHGWHDVDGAFVTGSPVLSWIADDGRRRGDGAGVLVLHATGGFATTRLDDPPSAIEPMIAELGQLLGVDPVPEPALLRAHRWSLASPRHPHRASYALHERMVGVCGDAWGPQARIEQAWVSGHELGCALAARFG
jgi:predicted NAD/FAD-dependent oxidoreductase